MSKKLDDLLTILTESMSGRLESDIPLKDNYWQHRDNYQQALGAAGGVHVPVKEELEIEAAKEAEVAKEAEAKKTEVEVTEKVEVKTAKEQLKELGL